MTEKMIKMSSEDETVLAALRQAWGDRYRVILANGIWAACRLGNSLHRFETDSPEKLRNMLADDSVQWAQETRRHRIR
jgi:hypothetical protein